MAKPRQTASGKWEIGLRHPSLPHGRKYFTFDTEAEAIAYSQQWKLMKDAGLPPPRELLDADNGHGNIRLSRVLGEWEQSGYAAPSQILTISTVNREVGTIKLTEASYKWLQGYVQWLKVEKQLTPQSIRHRIQCLGRAIDEYLRNHPAMVVQNPTRLLPKGYATYSDIDTKLAVAKGGVAKTNVQRDRRLRSGEEEKIIQVLSGYERPATAGWQCSADPVQADLGHRPAAERGGHTQALSGGHGHKGDPCPELQAMAGQGGVSGGPHVTSRAQGAG